MSLMIEQREAARSTEAKWHPRLLEADLYWQTKCAGREMPRRSDIDPTEIRGLLPHILLMDIDPSGRPKHRLIGTEIERRIGVRAIGCYLDEVLPEKYAQYMRGLYDKVIQTRRPLFSSSLYGASNSPLTPDFYLMRTARYMAPLSSDGTTIDIVFACQVFEMSPTSTSAAQADPELYFAGN